MKYQQEDFDPKQVKIEDYGNPTRRCIISPKKTPGIIEVGCVKGYVLDSYFPVISIGILPPRPEMEMKGIYTIKMIPKNAKDPFNVEEKWTQMIKVRPEGFLGVMSYSVSAYLVMRQLQGFTMEKMTSELASAFESGKSEADNLLADYKRIVRPRV